MGNSLLHDHTMSQCRPQKKIQIGTIFRENSTSFLKIIEWSFIHSLSFSHFCDMTNRNESKRIESDRMLTD